MVTLAERLDEAIDRLTLDTYETVVRDDGQTIRVRVVSLLEQIGEAIIPSGEIGGGGSSGKAKSKPPLAVNALDLWHEIRAYVHQAPDTAGTLRWMAQRAARHNVSGEMLGTLEAWISRALEICGQPELVRRPLPIRCPSCEVRWIYAELDGEMVRRDALTAGFSDGLMTWLECAHCAATWHRGPDLDALVKWMMAA